MRANPKNLDTIYCHRCQTKGKKILMDIFTEGCGTVYSEKYQGYVDVVRWRCPICGKEIKMIRSQEKGWIREEK